MVAVESSEPVKLYYLGQDIDEMEAPALREALRAAFEDIESLRRSQSASNMLFGQMLRRRREELRGMRS